MLDLVIAAGVLDDPEIEAERARLVRARRRADGAQALFLGGLFTLILFTAWIGTTA